MADAAVERNFWKSAGYQLLDRDSGGRLVASDDFLRAYLMRPELRPVDESCAAERTLHEALMTMPRRDVSAAELAALADIDARANYEIILRFRDFLLAHSSLEASYLMAFEERAVALPQLFIDHMAQAILRNILDGTDDALRPRAAELLFRSQKVSLPGGAIMLADEEIVDMHADSGGLGGIGRLMAAAQTPMVQADLDVLDESNAASYWERSDRYDMVLDITFTRPGLDALARVLEAWVRHFLDIAVSIQPVQSIQDEKWVWHVGLDAEATAILNDLYNGVDVDEGRMARILALFRLEFRDPSVVLPAIAGRPIYLGMAMAGDGTIRIKPQNLLLNLPIAEAA